MLYQEAVKGLIECDNHILLLRGKGKEFFELPGGRIEKGESSQEALAREVMEETGLTISIAKKIHDNTWPMNEKIQIHGTYFLCTTDTQEISLEAQFDEFLWAPIDQLHKAPVYPVIKEAFLALSSD